MTQYNLANDADLAFAVACFEKHNENKCIIEIIKVYPSKSNRQLRYVHKMFAYFAAKTGYTKEESKHLIKMEIGYYDEVDGWFIPRSLADPDTKEMGDFIDEMLIYAHSVGVPLLSPDEYWANVGQIEEYIKANTYGG